MTVLDDEPVPVRGKVLFLCPGLGGEEAGMGLSLAQAFPPAAALLSAASRELGEDAAAILARGDDRLSRCEVVQPILAAVALGAARAVLAAGVVPDLVAGHSVGELAAWASSGAVDDGAVVHLAAVRGRLMAEAAACAPGVRVVFRSSHAAQAAVLAAAAHGEVHLAEENAPDERVLAGDVRALEVALRSVPGRRVRSSGPWHTARMAPTVAPFRAALSAVPRRTPSSGILSCVTGGLAAPPEVPALLADAVAAPVRFEAMLATARRLGVRDVVVLGAGRRLESLVRRNAGGRLRTHAVTDLRSATRVASALAR